MADTTAQCKVERLIVHHELPRLFQGHAFAKRKLPLAWGGAFEFDAVSDDGTVAVCVSTSRSRTASGANAIGKFHKLKADAFYLLNSVGATRRVMAFTDAEMLAQFERERSRGRFPPESAIELLLVPVPAALAEELRAASLLASAEVSPRLP